MNEDYLSFLKFDAVVNVKTKDEFLRLVEFCDSRGLTNIKYLSNIGFENLHKNAGVQEVTYGDLCVEFRISDGYFTCAARKPYEEYGCKIISIKDLIS